MPYTYSLIVWCGLVELSPASNVTTAWTERILERQCTLLRHNEHLLIVFTSVDPKLPINVLFFLCWEGFVLAFSRLLSSANTGYWSCIQMHNHRTPLCTRPQLNKFWHHLVVHFCTRLDQNYDFIVYNRLVACCHTKIWISASRISHRKLQCLPVWSIVWVYFSL